MQTYVLSFVAATVLSALLTPLARAVAFRFGAVSQPGGRHIHGRAIPRLGGGGIFLAVLTTLGGLWAFGRLGSADDHEVGLWVGLLVSGSLMFAVGAYDDAKGARAITKLGFQLVAAVVAWACGFRVDVVDLPLMESFSVGFLSLPLTVLWIVGIINAVNLIDGLDGLAAGVVFFAGITNFVVAVIMGTGFVAVVMATVAGAVFGFLFYNFNPARIFMGDSGSYFLGLTLALCGISGPLQKASAAVSIAVPIVALGVPIIDTLLAMLRRFLERRPLFSPDRGHIHHRLLDMGITHRRAVLIIYGVTVALCVFSVAIAFARTWAVGAAILGVSVVLFGLVRFIGFFEYLAIVKREKQRIRSRHTEWLRKVIMLLPARLDRARSEDEVLEALRWLVREAKLSSAELTPPEGATAKLVGDDYQDMDERDVTQTTFTLGQGGRLRFAWKSELGDVPPQMDILLQLVVDQTELHLRRVGCAWAKQPVPEPAPALSVGAPSHQQG